MIVKMRKLRLCALSYDRDAVLSALGRTNAAEIKEHAATEETVPFAADGSELSARLASLEGTLAALSAHAPATKREGNAEEVAVGFDEFLAAKDFRARADVLVEETARLLEEQRKASSEAERLRREMQDAAPYAGLALPFSRFSNTRCAVVHFGTVEISAWEALRLKLEALPLTAFDATMAEDRALILVVSHKSEAQQAEQILSAASFSECPYHSGETGEELTRRLEKEVTECENAIKEAEESLTALSKELRPLKIYCDYVGFELEKAQASEKMQATAHTVFMEAFVPEDGEAAVKAALDALELPLFYEFIDPADDEFIPTLMRNNQAVSNFESITNMYSVPNAREIDPNTVMSFFYSLFLGFIMADMGYGIMMMAGGAFFWKKKKGGVKSLGGVFGIGGIFAFLWGILFNSLFGERVLPFTVMPDAQTAMYSLAGIELPSVLVISLLLGIIALCAGYVCKFVQCVHHGKPWDGVFDGLVWAAFSLGAFLAVVGLVEEFSLSALTLVGGIMAVASLLIAVLTAGRHEKFLGKVTKGFSSLYGLINYFTDVLSYIRLYGLMLTGAVIAEVVSDYSLQFLTSGSALVVLGAILMVVGHVFNLAISLLGAYIHTARLQYVEFFGRFFEGEGRLFEPLGSHTKYVFLKGEEKQTKPQKKAA